METQTHFVFKPIMENGIAIVCWAGKRVSDDLDSS